MGVHFDTCNATVRERSQLHICYLPLHHDGDHDDGQLTWRTDPSMHDGIRRL